MTVMLFGGDATMAESLRQAGLQVTPGPPMELGGPGATTALAGALRAAEGALAAEPPDAVLMAGDGDEALAVALTAVKLGIPAAWLKPADASGAALVGRVADVSLDANADAAAVASAIRDLAALTISAR